MWKYGVLAAAFIVVGLLTGLIAAGHGGWREAKEALRGFAWIVGVQLALGAVFAVSMLLLMP